VGARGGHTGTEGLSTFVLLALLAVIISIVRSVMKPGLGDESFKRKAPPRGAGGQRVATPAPAAPRQVTRNVERPHAVRDALAGGSDAARDAVRRTADAREAAARRAAETRAADARASARREANAPAAGSDWYIVLDVPRDAPRAEILSAVKLRIQRARDAGDAQAIANILRAAEAGMGPKGVRELARKLGTRS